VTTVPQAASLWHEAGVSTIPVLANGTKRPAIEWAEFQARIPELGEISQWWGNGREYGLAVICGSVSGNLEMTELEGSVALDATLMAQIDEGFEMRGLTYVWEGLRQSYSEWTPSGGLHLIYRISDHPVPGNEKIAVGVDGKVRAETRGEGGYVIVAPTSGICHPSGESWSLLGDSIPGVVPTISWQEREQLHEILRIVLDERSVVRTPPPSRDVVPVSPSGGPLEGGGSRPGDEWANRMEWADILEPEGWTLSHRRGEEEFWTRPGKSRRDGHSATVNYKDSGLLKVFSSSVPGLDPDGTYTKFGALAALRFNGNFSDAAKWLARQGFGTSHISPRAGNEIEPYIEEDKQYTLDDMGNGQRLMDEPARYFSEYRVRDVHRYVEEEHKPRHWNGTRWVQSENAILWETDVATRRMMSSTDETVAKCGARSRSWQKQKAMASAFFAQPGMTVNASDLDRNSRYLNLLNGVYDLERGELKPHNPSFMLTKILNASYDPAAKAPQWDQFLSVALPDETIRRYVQRCLGYTLLGNPSERALFVIYGPSGTGKSTFLETLNHVFGDYGETAPAGTFRTSRNTDDGAATPALHQLRGKRFVTTSETSEGVQWNEELVKRFTGRDMMRSRGLFEAYQTWRNEATIWLATNHAPRFSTDDRAIWNRVKLVPFTTVFLGDGQVLGMDEVLTEEADGILNWLLEGLADYLATGIGEPGEVTDAVNRLRETSDSVIQFLDDKQAEGVLVLDEYQVLSRSLLFSMYAEWCRGRGERPVGARRFQTRIESAERGIRLSPNSQSWLGVGRNSTGWLAGTS